MTRLLIAALAAFALTAAHAAQSDPDCGSNKGNAEVTIKACTRLIEFGGLDRPDLAKAYYVRGAEWAIQGNHERAIADFTSAIDLDPKLPGVHYSRALALSERSEHERAIADYDTALKLAPKDSRAYVGRAFEWILKGDYKRAIADYEALMRLDPGLTAWFGRGRVRFYAGDFTAAASDFLRAHQIDPSIYTAVWLYLARKRADIPGEKTLAQEAGTTGTGEWPAPIVGLYLGNLTPEAVQKAASTSINVTRQRDQRCEANFYIAQWQLMRGARQEAARLLDDARVGCQTSFIEHEGAVAELRRLQ